MLNSIAKDSQTAATLYKTDLLFDFFQVSNKIDNSFQIMRDLHDFFKKRADFELHYSKQLLDWSQEMPGSSAFFGFAKKEAAIIKEGSTLKSSILGVQKCTNSIALAHQQFGKNLQQEIVETIFTWLKLKEVDKKTFFTKGQQAHRKWVDVKSSVTRAKLEYEKGMRAIDSERDILEKFQKEEGNLPSKTKTERQQTRLSQVIKKGEFVIRVYQEAVKKANEYYNQLKNDVYPDLLEKLQQWEESRWFNSLESVFGQALIDTDFKEFVNSVKEKNNEEKNNEYEQLEFVQFNSRYANPLVPPPPPEEEKGQTQSLETDPSPNNNNDFQENEEEEVEKKEENENVTVSTTTPEKKEDLLEQKEETSEKKEDVPEKKEETSEKKEETSEKKEETSEKKEETSEKKEETSEKKEETSEKKEDISEKKEETSETNEQDEELEL